MKKFHRIRIIAFAFIILNTIPLHALPKQGQARADSLLTQLSKASDDTNKVNILYLLSKTYSSIDADKGLAYAEQALTLAEKIKWEKGVAKAHFGIGLNYMPKSDFEKTLAHYQLALKLSEKSKDRELTAAVLNQTGVVHDYLSDYKTALKYFHKALNLYVELRDKRNLAGVFNNIGVAYLYQSDNDKALHYFTESMALTLEVGDSSALAGTYGNLGIVYTNLADYPKSLEYHHKSLRINEYLGNKRGVYIAYSNIGAIYFQMGNMSESLEYQMKALTLSEEAGDKYCIAGRLNDIGNIYMANDPGKALTYFRKALKINEETGNRDYESINLINIASLHDQQADYLNALEYYLRASAISREIGSMSNLATCYLGIGGTYLSLAKDTSDDSLTRIWGGNRKEALKRGEIYSDSAVESFKDLGELKSLMESYKQISECQELLGDDKSSLQNYKNYVATRDSVFNDDNNKKIAALEKKRTEELNQKQLEIKDLQIRKAKNEKWYFVIGIFLMLCLSGVLFNRYRFKARANIIITREKKRSDDLLLNILPAEVAEELKEKGHADAKQFDEVTVLFTDFKGFTAIAERLSPHDLVRDLDRCFKEFDRITEKYGIEKIKTIGDSYMCAGGLPVENRTNANDTVNAALEIRNFMLAEKQMREAEGGTFFEVRIGIHTGPVVAGIVGIKKFAYDIWGDTVNIASRMESSGEPGKVNISGSTYELVRDKFSCTHRGMIEAKHKGMIDMYFVEAGSHPPQ